MFIRITYPIATSRKDPRGAGHTCTDIYQETAKIAGIPRNMVDSLGVRNFDNFLVQQMKQTKDL